MALPQIDVQTFNINISSLGKKFKFRPFLVKEEKLLVMAGESEDKSDMINAVQQIITNCFMGKVTIYNDEEIIQFQESPLEERINFIEGFSVKQFALIRQFYESMPQILHAIDFKCKACKKDNTLVIDGYENFFV